MSPMRDLSVQSTHFRIYRLVVGLGTVERVGGVVVG